VTDHSPATPLVRYTPQDIWPEYESGGMQFPPEDPEEAKRFDQARRYEQLHKNAPGPLVEAYEMPAAALEWAREGKGTSLLLWGYVGTGKSFSATAAGTLYAALHNRTFWSQLAAKYLRSVKNYDNRDGMDEMRSDLMRPGVLVLDDIGRSKLTDVDVESMTELLDERMAHNRVTLFTTNLMPTQFEEYFGGHLASRLLGGTKVLRLEGPDRRQKS
jgi:DNA replication protein DnaC